MKTGRYIFIFLLLLILIIIYVNKCKDSSDNAVNPSNAAKPALKVNGLIIKSSPLEDKIFSTGTLISNDEVELRNEIAGKITAIIFQGRNPGKKRRLISYSL
jgi:membrane fusion protein (multidrug efflux system)